MRISVADGPKGEYQIIREVTVGTADLHSLAQCRSKSGGVDVRFTDLTVRAESLVNEPTKMATKGMGWVPWVVGLVVVLAGVGGWLLYRRVAPPRPHRRPRRSPRRHGPAEGGRRCPRITPLKPTWHRRASRPPGGGTSAPPSLYSSWDCWPSTWG